MQPADHERELATLRATIATLERENAERAIRANAAIAAAQEQTYWLDRWGLDLNRVMAKPGAEEARAVVRRVRAVYRFVREKLLRPLLRLLRQ